MQHLFSGICNLLRCSCFKRSRFCGLHGSSKRKHAHHMLDDISSLVDGDLRLDVGFKADDNVRKCDLQQ